METYTTYLATKGYGDIRHLLSCVVQGKLMLGLINTLDVESVRDSSTEDGITSDKAPRDVRRKSGVYGPKFLRPLGFSFLIEIPQFGVV